MKKVVKYILMGFSLLVALLVGTYFSFPCLILESTRYAFRWWAGLEKAEVQVDGQRWVYLHGGRGETILFVHGFGMDKDRWGPFLKPFVGSHRVIVPDLPGFGESSRIATDNYDIPSQVRRLSRFAETLGLEPFHMIGVSMGGYMAAYYASEYPNTLKSLALMDAAGVQSRIPGYAWQRYRETGDIILLYRTHDQLDALMSVLFKRPPWIPGRIKDCIVETGKKNYAFYRKILTDTEKGGMFLLEDRLPRIGLKTLVLWGEDDHITHVSGVENFRQGLKDVTTVIIRDCGHTPFMEKRGEAVKAYREFLDGLRK